MQEENRFLYNNSTLVNNINDEAKNWGIGEPISEQGKNALENIRLELKSKRILPSSAEKRKSAGEKQDIQYISVAASFFNTEGGLLLFGVEDNGLIDPFDDSYDFIERTLTEKLLKYMPVLKTKPPGFYHIKDFSVNDKENYIVGLFIKRMDHLMGVEMNQGTQSARFYFRLGRMSKDLSYSNAVMKFNSYKNKNSYRSHEEDGSFVIKNDVPEKNSETKGNSVIYDFDEREETFINDNSKGDIEVKKYLQTKMKKREFKSKDFCDFWKEKYKLKELFLQSNIRQFVLAFSLGLDRKNVIFWAESILKLSHVDIEYTIYRLSNCGIIDNDGQSLIPRMVEINLVEDSFVKPPYLLLSDHIMRIATRSLEVLRRLISAYYYKKKDQCDGVSSNVPEWIKRIVLDHVSKKEAVELFASVGFLETSFLIDNISEDIKVEYFSSYILKYRGESGLNLIMREILRSTESQEELINDLFHWALIDVEKKSMILRYFEEHPSFDTFAGEEFISDILNFIVAPVFVEKSTESMENYVNYCWRTHVIEKENAEKMYTLIDKCFIFF